MSVQMELPAIPRARVRLGDADAAKGDVGDAKQDLPLAEIQKAMGLDVEAFLGYTKWEAKEAPPCAGFWEVTDHATGTFRERWWFTGGAAWQAGERQVPILGGGADPLMMAHSDFRELYAWRGLAAQHPDGYPSPPYYAFPGWGFPPDMKFAPAAPARRVRL